jgi:uracil permease
LPAIQGGTILGGLLLVIIVLTRQLEKLIKLFTPNVVGVILMLIAFGLLSPILKFITGVSEARPQGETMTMIFSLGLILFMAALSYHLKGFWRTISTLIGMIAGSLIFLTLGRINLGNITSSSWISFSIQWLESAPGFYWPAALAFGCSYIAVLVNSLGSLEGVAAITDQNRLPVSTQKGIFVNGISGVLCGFFGVFGTVSFSMSPGIILSNRVASRYAMSACGLILVLAVFIPKLASLLSIVPVPVVGAALCVALGGQIGAGIAIIASKNLSSRDYFVVGIPTFLGAIAGLFPRGLFSSLPGFIQVFLGNSLIVGIIVVLLLEHVLCREKS